MASAIVVCAAAVVLRAWNLDGYPYPNGDEGTYIAQAWATRTGRGLSHYTYWYDHAPVGWMQLAALQTLFPSDLASGELYLQRSRWLMLPVGAATNALLYPLARRLGLSRVTAVGAMFLHAVSPLAIALERQVYLDSFATVWTLLALVLALSPRRHLVHYGLAGCCFALAVLSKETCLPVLLALVWALWTRNPRAARPFALAAFLSGLLLVLVWPLYAALNDELLPGTCHVSMVETIRWQLFDRPTSGSVFVPGTPAHTLADLWLHRDAVLLIGGNAGAAAALADRRLRPLGLAVAPLTAFALRPGGYLPAMYISQLLPFYALAVAALCHRLLRPGRRAATRSRRALRPAVALLLIALVAPFAPHWYATQREVLTADHLHEYEEAARWIRNMDLKDRHRRRLVTDEILWLEAVGTGFTPGAGAIWTYKLDKDPSVAASLPRGWRDIDYVVSTVQVRASSKEKDLRGLRTLLRHARPVAHYNDVDLLRIPESVRHDKTITDPPVLPEVARCLDHSTDIWPYDDPGGSRTPPPKDIDL
ncbi:ArnT family glycosyltransferase [Streptomyces sp. G5(2025)]|uniref:ArnT family glycosyltransferase n=1 Tax=Streptomyces sp. G5(2025) TaxID=3406628 RepID=UPI003C1C1630